MSGAGEAAARSTAKDWVESRTGLVAPLGRFLQAPLPQRRVTLTTALGLTALGCFGLQLFTGLLLALYYRPTPEEAYASVLRILGSVPYGWLVRSLHFWGAQLLVILLFIHLLVTFYYRCYRAPRELTWMSGILVLGLVLGSCFSGSLFPWDNLAYAATQVGTGEAATVPVIGPYLVRLLRGGEEVGADTLSRFYMVHVLILPVGCVLLLLFHLYLVQKHGLTGEGETAESYWPRAPVLGAALGLVLLAGLTCLAGFCPKEVRPKADPLAAAPSGVRPEWYFLPLYETLSLVPSRVFGVDGALLANAAFAATGLLWFLLPFWDRREGRRWRAVVFVFVTVCWCGGVTVYSYVKALRTP